MKELPLFLPKNLGSREEVSQRLREGRVLEGCSLLLKKQQQTEEGRRGRHWPAGGEASVQMGGGSGKRDQADASQWGGERAGGV